MKNLLKFVYSTALVVMTWYVCSIYTRYGLYNWYAAVEKPAIALPDIWFPIIWAVLYVLMILAFYKVLKRAGNDNLSQKKVNPLFLGQLVLQIIWCYCFFYRGWLALGLAVILLLDLIVYKMILVFKGLDKYAAYLLYPYFWWLIYASFITATFVYIRGTSITF